MEAQPKTKNTRLGLSLAERIQVIEARQIGKSMRQLAAQFGCGKTQILNTLAQKDRYIQEWELLGGRNNPVLGARKRFRHTRNEEINRSVYQWYQQQSSNGQSVTGPMLQRQARLYATNLGIATFAASNGWLANFRRFYNICSPHPRKPYQKTTRDKKLTSNEQQASVHTDAEFVPVGGIPIAEEGLSCSQLLHSPEKDPLDDEPKHGDECEHVLIKTEPTTVDDESTSSQFSKEENSSAAVSTISDQHSISMDAERNYQSFKGTETSTSTKTMPTVTINHRKRRLLQHGETASSSLSPSMSRNDEVHQIHITRRRVCLVDVMNLARSRGLVTVLAKDEYGDDWLEIRPSIAVYRVPKYNYPTHLSRLIIDSSLQYFMEVLGHCVQKGSLYKDITQSLNQTETASILNALEGGYIVCQGIESVYKQVPEFHMKTAQEIGLSDEKFLTLPDYRYRSHDCLMWIDRRLGPRCPACSQSNHLTSEEEYSGAPIDLRYNPHQLHQHEH